MSDRVDPRVAHTRAEVHGVVIDLLRAEGPAAITHQRVAQASSVSRATVYRHWPDRRSLLLDAIDVRRPMPDLPERTGDLRTDLVAILSAVASGMMHDELMPTLISLVAQAETDPDFAGLRRQLSEVTRLPVFAVLTDAVEAGALPRDVDLDLAGAMLIGPLFALRFLRQRDLDETLIAKVVDGWLAAAPHLGGGDAGQPVR